MRGSALGRREATQIDVTGADLDSPVDGRVTLSRLLVDVARRVGGTLDLQGTLDEITQAVPDLLGFGVAVLNLVSADGGHLDVVTVVGPPELRQELLGTQIPLKDWQTVLAASEPIGALRFADVTTPWPDALPYWVPDLPVVADAGDWQAQDSLFAPLHDGDGGLLGVLSVDLPFDGRRPDAHCCELLELFAVQAGLALEHARLHARLQRSEAVFRRTFEHAPVGMAVFGPDRRYQQVNASYCAMLGRQEADLLGKTAVDFCHPDDRVLTERVSRDVRSGALEVQGVETRFLHVDGTVVWGRVTLTRLDDDEVLAHVEDITVARAAAALLEHRASSDPLTGLANRDSFDRILTARLALGGERVAVLFCDVDRFKQVNDTYGHAAGDELLQQIAAGVRGVLRSQDLAARLGGDEFVLLLDGVVGDHEALAVAERVRQAGALSLGDGVQSSLTVGVAVSLPGSTSRTLLARADVALYRAKQAGRDQVALAED